MGAERQGERRARISNFKSGNGSLSGGGTGNQAGFQASQGTEEDKEIVKSVEEKDSKTGDPHNRGLLEVKNISDPVTGVVAISVPDKLENKRLSASQGRGKRKLEEGEPSKEEATPSKKRKSTTGMKAHDNKNDIEETGKEGSEMEKDESGGNDNSQPMVDKDDKDNDKKDMDSEREKNKEPKKEMTKDSLSKDKKSAEEGLFLDNLKKLTEGRLG
ncbi:pheromone-processing carboxypeptidase KEX1-like [Cryptomeria japonica]|uniref:pheromone-processing carboxypeptidase KEX1-like n=1 Tax=Cryptomeria japonica TaxID=3369 RepID=UPI0027D9FE78|nr:pheromone-processing carboxypeptidase KEX1-like [Cryptomeria japonica]